ncbi:hypothetical protein ACOJIP_000505 [Escherichia coli]
MAFLPGSAGVLKTVYRWLKARLMNYWQESRGLASLPIAQASKDIDPAGKGVSASTILRNKQCHALYKKHSLSKNGSHKKHISLSKALNDPTASELRRAHLLASKDKTALITTIILIERELKKLEEQNCNLREKILSFHLPNSTY